MNELRHTVDHRYSNLLIGLHWAIALIVIPMLSVSFFLEDVSQPLRPTAIMLHKSLGLTILVLMILRLVVRWKKGCPPLPAAMSRWEMGLARIVQSAFYVLIIAMAVVGWVMSTLSNHVPIWFGVIRIPFPGLTPNADLADMFFQAHQLIAWALIVLLGLHIAGALKHAMIDKDKVMDSMLP